jgi:hypothetical protein
LLQAHGRLRLELQGEVCVDALERVALGGVIHRRACMRWIGYERLADKVHGDALSHLEASLLNMPFLRA